MLTIEKINKDDALCFELAGRLDATTSPDLEAGVRESLDDAEKMVFDLAQLEYISSAGLRVLLMTQKNMVKKGGLVIKNAGPEIMEIFELTGFSDVLDIE